MISFQKNTLIYIIREITLTDINALVHKELFIGCKNNIDYFATFCVCVCVKFNIICSYAITKFVCVKYNLHRSMKKVRSHYMSSKFGCLIA